MGYGPQDRECARDRGIRARKWLPVPGRRSSGVATKFRGALSAIGVPMGEFMKLTKIPIIIFYGDFIPEKPSENPGQDGWRVRLELARKWRDTVNRHGGDVTVVHLPEVGVHGNTHFPFSDLNNKQVVDLMSKFLSEKKLD